MIDHRTNSLAQRSALAWVALAVVALLAGCASPPVTEVPQGLFADHLFAPASERIVAKDVFALSADMQRYIASDIANRSRATDRRQVLFDALYSRQQLKLEYDTAMTRNAAQAFAARAGNCLSLVIMTAAFARELNVPVRYNVAYLDETWSRSGGIEFFSGHVNLTLGRPLLDIGAGRRELDERTIDFLSPVEIRGLRTREVSEGTIVAMYMNNRAAESLAEGHVDNAYWWARAAIQQDPNFTSAYNTLGVVFHRRGAALEAERALRYALERNDANAHVVSNLVNVLHARGLTLEAQALAKRLERLEPNPPFAEFYRGLAAMRNGDYTGARALFARQIETAPYNDELHFWLAAAHLALGQLDQARSELKLAIEYSTNGGRRDIYSAKLAHIRSSQVH